MENNISGLPRVGAVIAAGGTGSRMGTKVSKLRLALCDMPVIAWSIKAIQSSDLVSEIVISAAEADIEYINDLVREMRFEKVKKIIRGGATRQESVYLGLLELGAVTHALVHDGARALIRKEEIDSVIAAAAEHGAAALGVRAKDTIKIADEGLNIISTPPRARLWQIQTPQVFEKELILRAHALAREEGFLGSDDCEIAERLGKSPKIVEGRYDNIKITTPEDMVIASALKSGGFK